MREINFRAWDVDAGEMIYSDKDYPDTYFFEFVDHKLKCIGIDPDGFPGDQWSPPGPSSYVIENIMQFTGLHDRNGRDIYEGDIIKSIKSIGEIVFLLGCFEIKWHKNSIGFNNILDIHARNDGIVIGNIYENPELLK